MLEFLATHPNVAADGYREVHYFNLEERYKRGTEWYRRQLPYSNENQITIEKTPFYLTDNNSSGKVYELNPRMKIIIAVCDPVVRAVSFYMQLKVNGDLGKMKGKNETEFFQKALYGKNKNNLKRIYPNEKNNILLKHGFYYTYLLDWLKYFPLEQILLVNGDRFKKEPYTEIDKLQSFLNLEPLIKKEHFVYKKDKGFFCLKEPTTTKVKCMRDSGIQHKGRKHPSIDLEILNDIREIYKTSNQKFFKLINESAWWPI